MCDEGEEEEEGEEEGEREDRGGEEKEEKVNGTGQKSTRCSERSQWGGFFRTVQSKPSMC